MLFSEQITVTATKDNTQYTTSVNLTQFTGDLFIALDNHCPDKTFYSIEYSLDELDWYRVHNEVTRELGGEEKIISPIDKTLVEKMPYVRISLYSYSADSKTVELAWGVI